MDTQDYLRILTEEFHSTVIATLDEDGHPATRVIDMMLCDKDGVYFLTARGKAFYSQLVNQQFIALSAVKDKKSISLKGKVRYIGHKYLNEIFEKNTYMQKIYPEGTRDVLEVFQIYEADGQFFDISDPSHVTRGSFTLGKMKAAAGGYFITSSCIGCGRCLSACPQRCIDTSSVPAVIDQDRCLHCGACREICPANAVIIR